MIEHLIAPAAISTGMAAISLLEGRLHPDLPPSDRPLDGQNFVLWVNPRGGGDRAGRIGDRFARELADHGLRVHRLHPGNPSPLEDLFRKFPSGNVIVLPTVSDRVLRTERLEAVLKQLPPEPPQVLIVVGGDGTIVEAKAAAERSASALVRPVPHLFITRGGSACDYGSLTEAPRRDIVHALGRSTPVAIPTAVASIETASGTQDLDVSHTLDFGTGAVVFKRGDRKKFGWGWLKGTNFNYLAVIPGIIWEKVVNNLPFLKGVLIREDPVPPFWVHYQVNDGPVLRVETSDFLLTGMRRLAKALYCPTTPLDGVGGFLMPANAVANLPLAAESGLRGLLKRLTRDPGFAVVLGNQLFLLGRDRQIILKPGDRLTARFFEDEAGTVPKSVSYQGNGEYRGEGHTLRYQVTAPYPHVLVDRDSPLASWHVPGARRSAPAILGGLAAFAAIEALPAISGDPILQSGFLLATGLAGSLLAPQSYVVGLAAASLAIPAALASRFLADVAGLGPMLAQTGLPQLIGALTTFAVAKAVARKLLNRVDFFQYMQGQTVSSKWARYAGAAATGLIAGLNFLLRG